MEKYELRNDFINKVKNERKFNIPEQHNYQKDADYVDYLESRILNDKKYCMPDNVNSKEEHLQYLKDIGYVKKLKHHKDTTCGLYAFDCEPKELLNKFNSSQSDAHNIECSDFEQLLKDWEKFCNDENDNKSPFFQITYAITYA